MLSDSTRDDTMSHIKNTQTNDPYTQTRENEQIDKYREYLAHKDEPADNSRNPKNLFHEFNDVDTYWLNIARANLSRRS